MEKHYIVDCYGARYSVSYHDLKDILTCIAEWRTVHLDDYGVLVTTDSVDYYIGTMTRAEARTALEGL
jgi:hypothetical protein